ncbi:MAG: DUF58 domain-containing protein, partial [Candidatus Bathyarchaeota archaeon]
MSDILILYANKRGVFAYRLTPNRLSNGDENEIKIFIENHYSFSVHCKIIDEIPFEFQIRDLLFKLTLESNGTKIFNYYLRPVKRGEYNFGCTNVYALSPIGFVERRYKFEGTKIIPVYPSYVQMKKY